MLELLDGGCLVDLVRLWLDRPIRFVGWSVLHACSFWMRPRPRHSAGLERLVGGCVLLAAVGLGLTLTFGA